LARGEQRDQHGRVGGVLEVAPGKSRIPSADEVIEALAYGWVDSKMVRVDADRTMMRYCPRKPTSGWSRPNKQRVERLLAEGRMAPAGRRSIDVANDNGAWSLLDDVGDLVVPPDLAMAFCRHKGPAARWESCPPWAKRTILEWIVQAKKPETRAKRIRETARRPRWASARTSGLAGPTGADRMSPGDRLLARATGFEPLTF
jgi:uncharacterized protein YdeI (YjbR/CyaY-like superfamily)